MTIEGPFWLCLIPRSTKSCIFTPQKNMHYLWASLFFLSTRHLEDKHSNIDKSTLMQSYIYVLNNIRGKINFLTLLYILKGSSSISSTPNHESSSYQLFSHHYTHQYACDHYYRNNKRRAFDSHQPTKKGDN